MGAFSTEVSLAGITSRTKSKMLLQSILEDFLKPSI